MDRTGTIERLSGFFAESPAAAADVAAAWLYGSFARGDARADSDVDVAALFRHTPAATFDALPLRLEGEIERLLRRTTQVVTMNHAPVDLRARVLRDGVLLVDSRPVAPYTVRGAHPQRVVRPPASPARVPATGEVPGRKPEKR